MIDFKLLNLTTRIVTLNVSDLNIPTKKQRLSNWIKTQVSTT